MTITHRRRGADALIASLEAAGVTRIFTLSGNHIMPIFDAVFESGISLIHTRHEASTVHMADAWTRITGQVGIALVTGGPGHANAVSALYTAAMAEAPLVLLSGHAPNNQLGQGAFQKMSQAEMAAPVCKASWTCAGAGDIASDITKAIRIARTGRPGPVHLSLPTDALGSGVAALPVDARSFERETTPLDASLVRQLIVRLVSASKPLILVGPACMTRPLRALTATLEQAIGVPVIGMESPRGIADTSLGAFAQVVARSDCVLLLGKPLDFTLRFGKAPGFPAGAEVCQIDADLGEFERSRRALGERLRLPGQADAATAVQALTVAAADVRPSLAQVAWLAEVRDAVAYRLTTWANVRSELPERLHPAQMLRPHQALLDSHPDSVLICDGGKIGQWAIACLAAPHRVINGVAGSIGAGLPYALAARCASPPDAPVIAVMGDGTVGLHIAEFETAMRYGLGFVAMIGNDARWNAEYQIQLRDYGAERTIGCDLRPMRYDAVAAAFGAHGAHVDAAADLLPAAQRALASGLPASLNVMIEGVPAPLIVQ